MKTDKSESVLECYAKEIKLKCARMLANGEFFQKATACENAMQKRRCYKITLSDWRDASQGVVESLELSFLAGFKIVGKYCSVVLFLD